MANGIAKFAATVCDPHTGILITSANPATASAARAASTEMSVNMRDDPVEIAPIQRQRRSSFRQSRGRRVLLCYKLRTMDSDDRTTALGLYHFARSYRAAARSLAKTLNRRHATHPEVPQDFLFIHAIELYLKSFLRLHGYSVKRLKKVGHQFADLEKEFLKKGGWLADEEKEVISLLTSENVFGARYIATGYFHRATTEALSRTADSLHDTVRGALRDAKIVCAS